MRELLEQYNRFTCDRRKNASLSKKLAQPFFITASTSPGDFKRGGGGKTGTARAVSIEAVPIVKSLLALVASRTNATATQNLQECELVQYNLEQLGPTGFQDLAGSLAIKTFGPKVTVMGRGRDGGRDMTFNGSLVFPNSADVATDVWNGYTVFQVKHKVELAPRPDDNARWLWGQIRDEMALWADAKSGRNPVPDHMIFISNVPLSPYPKAGGHDVIQKNIERYISNLSDSTKDISDTDTAIRESKYARLSKIKNWLIWDGYQVQSLITLNPGIRRGFNTFLTIPDVFAGLSEFTNKLPLDKLEPGLKSHARTTLVGEGQIHFDEAGSGEGRGVPVHDVAVDLPVIYNEGKDRSTIFSLILARAEHVLKPSMTTRLSPRHLVVTGAPGNGKTTLSKFLVQVFRAAMLNGAEELSVDHKDVIAGTAGALKRFQLDLPKNRRWAMRIDLAEYAESASGLLEESTLLRWIAHKVSIRSNVGDVSATALQSWMQQWAWFLVLDGLDEVTDPAMRKRLINQVTEFVSNAEADDCDVFVVLTTRPVGYTENIAPTQFERVDLDYLNPDEAVEYGTRATRVRLGNDLDRIDRVVRQLKVAARDDALKNLLRTPLQVMIMTIIVDGAGQLAPDRYSLFWGYYETIFRREREKQGGLHRMLQEHGPHIQRLHERVGFELQVRSESAGRSFATLTAAELKDITWQVLADAGFKPGGVDSELLEHIFKAATQRLVLIAPRGSDDGYGFDVRSLQELMAAMQLTNGPLPETIRRLRIAGPSPHWRNVWIFAAGRLFAEPLKHQHESIVELIEDIDTGAPGRLGRSIPIGPSLALALTDDGMARSQPIWRGRLIAAGLKILNQPASADLPASTRIFVRFAESGEEQRAAVAGALRETLGTSPTTKEVLTLIPAAAEEAGASLQTRSMARILVAAGSSMTDDSAAAWRNFDDEIDTFPIIEDKREQFEEAAAVIRLIAARGSAADDEIVLLTTALADSSMASGIDDALAHIQKSEWELIRVLRDRVIAALDRAPLEDLLEVDSSHNN